MQVPVDKPTDEALAFITLYKAMNPKIKKEVKEMIINDFDNQGAFTYLSLQSWDSETEGLDQSKLWEQFYNKPRNV